MKHRFILFVSTLVLSIVFGCSALAYDVKVDGIYYNLDDTNKTAEVTNEDYDSYSGVVVIPASFKVNEIDYSVTSIGKSAFSWCSGLTSISIPNSVTSIGKSAFEECSSLTSVTIPNSVTSIGDFAFSRCTDITSITIPNSVTSIGDGAFYGCSCLTSITIPNSVTSIGDCAFSGCMGINQTIIVDDMFVFLPTGYEGHYSIPENISIIIGGAFSGCSGLTSVTIPNSVTSIGDMAFYSCSGLTSVTIPNSVTSIGGSAFYGCSCLTSVTIPNSVTSIGSYAFEGCSGLTSVTISNSVTSIGYRAFADCRRLTSVIIPNSVTSIGERAFLGCSGLTSITIPNSVTSIGEYAFEYCHIKKLYYDCSVDPNIYSYYLKELIIGDNTIIVQNYFESAPLTRIVLGKNVTHIKPGAFSNSQLEEFTITGEEPPYLYPNVFGSQDLSKATLYVPESKTEYYQTTEPWSKFGKVLTLSGETPEKPEEPQKCATPSISYSDGQLQFSCETEGAKCNYTISCPDAASGETSTENSSVTLNAYYDITCYAKAEGFINSDLATAKLYWLTSSGSLEGAGINNVSMRGIAIQSAGGFINISGLDNNETVSFYGIDGKSLGTATAINGTTSFAAQSGSIVVAKIGKESIKIAVE